MIHNILPAAIFLLSLFFTDLYVNSLIWVIIKKDRMGRDGRQATWFSMIALWLWTILYYLIH